MNSAGIRSAIVDLSCRRAFWIRRHTDGSRNDVDSGIHASARFIVPSEDVLAVILAVSLARRWPESDVSS
jgi:hypothetical protein